MKKAITLTLALVLCLNLCACGAKETKETIETIETIELTADNINNYVQFDGEFTNGTSTKTYITSTWGLYSADATLEFQAYPITAGKFENVEITLIGTSDDFAFTSANNMGYYWHLTDAENRKELAFTFKLGVDGSFSKNYSIECSDTSLKLSGNCDFIIKSVSGTFIPD